MVRAARGTRQLPHVRRAAISLRCKKTQTERDSSLTPDANDEPHKLFLLNALAMLRSTLFHYSKSAADAREQLKLSYRGGGKIT